MKAIEKVLEIAGIEFTSGDAPGVWVRRRKSVRPVIQRSNGSGLDKPELRNTLALERVSYGKQRSRSIAAKGTHTPY